MEVKRGASLSLFTGKGQACSLIDLGMNIYQAHSRLISIFILLGGSNQANGTVLVHHMAIKYELISYLRYALQSLNYILLLDDRNMSSMFAAHRFDVMVVLDKDSIESAFKQINFTDFAYADYRHKQNIGIFYGLSKLSANTKVNAELSRVLLDMSQSGRITQIYQDDKLEAPLRLF
ncbi:hypothetical protein KT99_17316 [Shewanella benthica KT99]|uniref:Solute-binding protein family 3/N-terminal domain-containing protein n=2 Tax=Shewanella benthica TaxID=43661 RepID=A9D5X3_9GAMM|nr:hypothetical protein KT99_17316 [Shewanella benthica KT99]